MLANLSLASSTDRTSWSMRKVDPADRASSSKFDLPARASTRYSLVARGKTGCGRENTKRKCKAVLFQDGDLLGKCSADD
ncbi:hypothetical protein DOTSEDRAFT_73563 [Dothistroma septosporum NZE10]|uniref:Uncharacterized protein n=1 Tax=Dothistroma septosporum (strain NZE10 / CBS 128990) TaxID=675120 RepID=N1PGD9_DOTSN|nr:hypothetical protein DOTSEDRAFT_73563 [Dothistroma septosporum NZE10]